MLLSRGADPTIRNHKGIDVLELASEYGNNEIITMLGPWN
jgi:ankyrin repeat protein